MIEFNPAALDKYFDDKRQEIQAAMKVALEKGDKAAWNKGLSEWRTHFGANNNDYIKLLGTKETPINVVGKDLTGFDFNQIRLENAHFQECTFNGNNFTHSSLKNCTIDASTLREVRFNKGVMENVSITNGTTADLMITESILSNVKMETTFLAGKTSSNYIGRNESVSCLDITALTAKGEKLDIVDGDKLRFKENKQVYASDIISLDAGCVGTNYQTQLAANNKVVPGECHTYSADELEHFSDYKVYTKEELKKEAKEEAKRERAEKNNLMEAAPSIFKVSWATKPSLKGVSSSNLSVFAPIPLHWNGSYADFKRNLVHLTFTDFNQQIVSERNVQDEPKLDMMQLGAEYSAFGGFKKTDSDREGPPKYKVTLGGGATKLEVGNTEMNMTSISNNGTGNSFGYSKWLPSANAEVETGIATNKGPIVVSLRANMTLPSKKEQVSSFRSDLGYDVTNTTSLTKLAQRFEGEVRLNAWDFFSRKDYDRDHSFVMWSPFLNVGYATPTVMKEAAVLTKNGVTHTENATFTMPGGLSYRVGLYFGL